MLIGPGGGGVGGGNLVKSVGLGGAFSKEAERLLQSGSCSV